MKIIDKLIESHSNSGDVDSPPTVVIIIITLLSILAIFFLIGLITDAIEMKNDKKKKALAERIENIMKKVNLEPVFLAGNELTALTSSDFLRNKYAKLYSELTAQNDTACPGMNQTYILSEESRQQLERLKCEIS